MSDFVAELKNVQKRFQNFSILENINFKLKAGEKVSICGDSGCGKTTLVNILGLLDFPTNGEVFWAGKNVVGESATSLAKLRAKIFGYIFQQSNLIPELNVIENILFPRKIISNCSEEDVIFAKDLLRRVRLSGFERRNVSTLSGGEKQRVAVVRSLINRPRVVIADEPTGNLDEKSANAVMNMTIDLCGEFGSALLLITHNMRFAEMMEATYVLSQASLKKE